MISTFDTCYTIYTPAFPFLYSVFSFFFSCLCFFFPFQGTRIAGIIFRNTARERGREPMGGWIPGVEQHLELTRLVQAGGRQMA
jgi:hypothetical protein